MSALATVRRVVMFKHGVAYLERGGPAAGSFELSFKFKEDEMPLARRVTWTCRAMPAET